MSLQLLYLRKKEAFMQQPILVTLRWIRTFGDLVFITGAVAMAWQVVLGLKDRSDRASTSRLQPQKV